MSIKLFISDLDKTLLPNKLVDNEQNLVWNEEIQLANINAIEKLQKNNIKFGIATGKMLGQIEHVNTQIDNKTDFFICQNGNYIYNQKYELLQEKNFNVRENLKIIKYIREFGFKPFFLDKETIYIDLRYISYETTLQLKKVYKNNYIQMLNWNNPWEIEHSKIKPGLVSLDVTRLSEKQKLDLANIIQEDLDFTKVSISDPNIIDIYPKNSSKFNAIEHLCQLLNLQLDEIAYIGDSDVDICVFENLKYSFCMDHARENVKKHCNNIVENVAQAIKRVVEINEKN